MRGVIAVCVAVGASYLPWISVMSEQAEERPIGKSANLLMTAGRTFSEFSARHFILFVGLLALGVAAHRSMPKEQNELAAPESAASPVPMRDLLRLLLLWAFVPVLLALLVSVAVAPVYRVRNLIIILPALILIAAIALEQIDRRWFRSMPLATTVIVCALLADLSLVKSYYVRATKEPFRQFTEHVLSATHAGESSAVWVVPTRNERHFNAYFEMLNSSVRTSRPQKNGQPAGNPSTLWILARGEEPHAPPGYKQVELIHHEPDRLSPWPGQPMALARYARILP
jgi:hypothetical protein